MGNVLLVVLHLETWHNSNIPVVRLRYDVAEVLQILGQQAKVCQLATPVMQLQHGH